MLPSGVKSVMQSGSIAGVSQEDGAALTKPAAAALVSAHLQQRGAGRRRPANHTSSTAPSASSCCTAR